MASKNKAKNLQKDHVTVKWVKRARMFCKTEVKGGSFSQTWASHRHQLP